MMKCVCPMGGDRTCPDNCLLAAWHSLPDDQKTKVRRVPIVEALAKQGYTQEAMAMQLGVSQNTISLDLANLSTIDKLKPTKTATNPKGAGRPKGGGKSAGGGRKGAAKLRYDTITDDDRSKLAAKVLDEGKTILKTASDAGVSVQLIKTAIAKEEGRREAEPIITPDMLSMSAQEKLQTAIRQHQRKLDLTFEARVQEEIGQRLDHLILPVWRKKIAEAKKIYDVRRSITDRKTFNLIVRCLHTDTRRHIDDKTADDAFTRFMALEKYLLNEKDSPTPFTGLPTTAAEWEQRKQEAMVMRRAKRGHANIEKRACT